MVSVYEDHMEISGLEPEITICKIAVFPIKLYPLIIQRLPELFGIYKI